jgi:glycosyltransferase involved in cell wall biosynthesis
MAEGMTIIVPAWRAAPFLPKLFSSLSEQDNLSGIDIEVLVGVDGCQQTRSHLALAGWPDNARVFFFPENNGPYVVWNSLVPLASHDYFMFFGVDDAPLPFLVDRHVCIRDGFDIVAQRMETGKVAVGAFAIWRTAWMRMGGFMPWRCQADSEFRMRAGRMALTTGVIGEPTFIRGCHPLQLTRSGDTRIGSPLRESYRKLQKTLPAKTISPATAAFLPLDQGEKR